MGLLTAQVPPAGTWKETEGSRVVHSTGLPGHRALGQARKAARDSSEPPVGQPPLIAPHGRPAVTTARPPLRRCVGLAPSPRPVTLPSCQPSLRSEGLKGPRSDPQPRVTNRSFSLKLSQEKGFSSQDRSGNPGLGLVRQLTQEKPGRLSQGSLVPAPRPSMSPRRPAAPCSTPASPRSPLQPAMTTRVTGTKGSEMCQFGNIVLKSNPRPGFPPRRRTQSTSGRGQPGERPHAPLGRAGPGPRAQRTDPRRPTAPRGPQERQTPAPARAPLPLGLGQRLRRRLPQHEDGQTAQTELPALQAAPVPSATAGGNDSNNSRFSAPRPGSRRRSSGPARAGSGAGAGWGLVQAGPAVSPRAERLVWPYRVPRGPGTESQHTGWGVRASTHDLGRKGPNMHPQRTPRAKHQGGSRWDELPVLHGRPSGASHTLQRLHTARHASSVLRHRGLRASAVTAQDGCGPGIPMVLALSPGHTSGSAKERLPPMTGCPPHPPNC